MFKINNLKKIRKDLNLKQDELTGNNICRTDISKIENNKKDLKYPLAVRLSHNINNALNNIGRTPPYQVTPELLIGNSQFRVDDILEEIKQGITEDRLIKVDNAYKELPAEWYKKKLLVGVIRVLDKDIYKNTNLILKYCIYLSSFTLTSQERLEFKIILMNAYMVQMNYIDAITVACSIEEYIKNTLTIESEFKLLYNLAICYRETEQHEKALEMINRCTLFKIKQYKYNVLLTQANIHYSLNNRNDAIKCYKKIINSTSELNTKCLSISNLASMYLEDNCIDLAEKTINISIQHINSIDIITKCSILKNIVLINIYNNKIDQVNLKKLFIELQQLNSIKKINAYIIEISQNVLKSEEMVVMLIEIAKECGIAVCSKAKEIIASKYKKNNNIINLLF